MSDGLAGGRYRLRRVLARGGMGEVWLAVLEGAAGFEKHVVVKRVLAHLDDDPEFLTRFIDEARIAATLSHANVVQVFDLGEDEAGFFLAMEWVDGWDLRKLLRTLTAEDERLPDSLAVYIAAELASGLGYAHSRTDQTGAPLHIVHRDVSPSNVLIARTGEVKLTDFGIASARRRLGRTVTGQLRGKFAYMSPEQASGHPVDGRSDLFALGALLYEMLAGRKAFIGDGDIAVLERVRGCDHPPLAELRPDIDPALVALVERAMAESASDRFADASEFEAALREHLAEKHGVVGRAALADWLDGRLRDDPIFRAQDQPGGASLDDLLNLQLDGADGLTPSATASGRRRLPDAVKSGGAYLSSGSRSSEIQLASHSGRTMTRAVVPTPRRRGGVGMWLTLSLLLVGGIVTGFVAWPSGPRVVVETAPSGAQVYVDGRPVGVSDLEVALRPGTHRVEVRMPGYVTATRSVDVARGDLHTARFELSPADRAVAFHSVPAGALIRVGDVEIVAGNSVPVPVGRPISVTMTLDGYEPLVEEMTIGATTTVVTRRLTPAQGVAALTGIGAGDAGTEDADGATPGDAETSTGDTGRPARDTARADRDAPRADTGDPRNELRTEPRDDPRADDPSATSDTGDQPAGPVGSVVVRFVEPPMVGSIEIDGRSHGTNRDLQTSIELPAGPHRVRVTNAAGGSFERNIIVEADAAITVPVVWN